MQKKEGLSPFLVVEEILNEPLSTLVQPAIPDNANRNGNDYHREIADLPCDQLSADRVNPEDERGKKRHFDAFDDEILFHFSTSKYKLF